MVGRWIMGLNYFVKNVCICDYIRLQTFGPCQKLNLPMLVVCGVLLLRNFFFYVVSLLLDGVSLLLDVVSLLLDVVSLLLHCVVFVPRSVEQVPLYAWHVVLYLCIFRGVFVHYVALQSLRHLSDVVCGLDDLHNRYDVVYVPSD